MRITMRFNTSPACLLCAVLAVPLAACGGPVEEAPPPAAPERAPFVVPRPGPVVSTWPAPVLVFEKIEGVPETRAHAAFAPARKALGECRPGQGGVVRLRLATAGSQAQYVVEPATTLGPAARRCVLEALSTVDVEGISGDASPSAKPSGFTALIRLEW
jgi:hypothetical protein